MREKAERERKKIGREKLKREREKFGREVTETIGQTFQGTK